MADTSQTSLEVKPRQSLRPNNFDVIRLLAALQVVLFHGIEHLGIEGFGQSWICSVLKCFPGVPIFFVISGFLVSASFERRSNVKTYAVNRFLRIYPGLWICFLVSIASVFLLKPEVFRNTSITEFVAWIGAQLTLFQFFNPDFLRDYGIGVLNGSLWTIPVELQFYVAMPIFYYLCSKLAPGKNKIPLVVMLIAIFLFLAINQTLFVGLIHYRAAIWHKLLACSMLPYFWLFLVGVAIQQHFHTIRWLFDGKFLIPWLLLHGAFVWLATELGAPTGSERLFPLLGISLAGITMACAYTLPTMADKILHHNDISYGVYIYHALVINAFVHLGLVGNFGYLMGLFVGTITLAYLSWILVERPCMKLKKKWVKKTPQP